MTCPSRWLTGPGTRTCSRSSGRAHAVTAGMRGALAFADLDVAGRLSGGVLHHNLNARKLTCVGCGFGNDVGVEERGAAVLVRNGGAVGHLGGGTA